MHTAKTTPRSQRRRLASAPIQIISTTFIMDAMLGRCRHQLKMPRPDAYDPAVRPCCIAICSAVRCKVRPNGTYFVLLVIESVSKRLKAKRGG